MCSKSIPKGVIYDYMVTEHFVQAPNKHESHSIHEIDYVQYNSNKVEDL